jgi:hypothetical protein
MDLARRDTEKWEFGVRTRDVSRKRESTLERDLSIPPSVRKDTLSRTFVAGRIARRDTLVNGIIGSDAKRIVLRERLTPRELVTRNDV